MGFENFRNKPKTVQEKISDQDTEALAAMGRKGAEVANAAKAKKAENEKLLKEINDMQAEEERRTQTEQANEHIIDPDGNDLDHFEEK